EGLEHPVSQSESPVVNAIRQHDWSTKPSILVAVSGGADSIALLHSLIDAGLTVGVAHLDHTTREGASTEDAAWLEAHVALLEIPYYAKRVDVPALAETSSQSFEEVARHTRYDFLVETARANNYDAIATAHHADDQAETVLMRILRGTSTTGLAGIPVHGQWNGLPLIRPLLTVTRADIIVYLTQRKIPWREDASNIDQAYLRNRIRNDLLPQLRDAYNANVTSALNRLADLARVDDQFLAELAEQATSGCVSPGPEIDRESFRALHPALQRRVMQKIAQQVGGLCDFEGIEGAIRFICNAGTSRHYDLGRNVQLSNGREQTIIVKSNSDESAATTEPLPVPGQATLRGRCYSATLLTDAPTESLINYCTPNRQVIDADKLSGALAIRFRQPGDRFSPMGMNGTRKLKDYFGDLGLPPEQRDATPLLVCGDLIVWVVGHALANEFAITVSTTRLLQIEVSDAAE
ncbi:MAG: tRNA lysidine(34) synthetase TilS, partial [Candidatus Hydrogenedentota bacterium]